MMTTALSEIRKQFPALFQEIHGYPLIYLDSAATSLKPNSVIEATVDYYRKNFGTVNRAVYSLAVKATERYHRVRQKLQAFLGAESEEEIIFTKGTTESLNLIAHILRNQLSSKDAILITEMEHHSNIVPWQLLAEEKQCRLLVAKVTEEGEIDVDNFKQLLQQGVKIVSFTHVSNVLGTINPVKKLAGLAKEYGALVIIDGAQAASHIPIDVIQLGVDFYTLSAHKAFGPTGLGILYGKKALLEALPPYQGGGDMIEKVTFEKTTFNTLPFKYEAGTPNIAAVVGFEPAIDFINTLGKEQIRQHVDQLLHYAEQELLQIPGLRILGQSASKTSLTCFAISGKHPLDIASLLDLRGIAIRSGHHCAQPLMRKYGLSASSRASFSIYNTLEEVQKFIEYLKMSLEKL